MYGANCVHVYLEIWDTGILKLINFNVIGKKEQQCDSLMYAFIKLYEFSWSSNMRIPVISGSAWDLVCTLLLKRKKNKNKKKKKKKKQKCQNLNKLPDLI